MNKISELWDTLKLYVIILYLQTYIWISKKRYEQSKILTVSSICNFIKELRQIRYQFSLYHKEFIDTKHIILNAHRLETIANIFCALAAAAWLCEKMKVNLKIEGLSYMFENDTIINNPARFRKDCFQSAKVFSAGAMRMPWVGIMYIRSEYGHKILSQLSVQKELMESADEWFSNHLKRDWVTVHFRGTDCVYMKKQYRDRYRLMLDDYVVYLQSVLNDCCDIFVCSDQAQFIDKMYTKFPGRVCARDIQRSYDGRALHIDPEYEGVQQKQDALIDLLILAKADLVYTTGSGFVDAARFLNPSIKIISLDERWLDKGFSIGRDSSHSMPIPRKDLFKHLVKNY